MYQLMKTLKTLEITITILAEKLLKLKAFKDIKQHVVLTSVAESQMALGSAMREFDLKRHFYTERDIFKFCFRSHQLC